MKLYIYKLWGKTLGIYITLSVISILVCHILMLQIRKRFNNQMKYRNFTLVMIAVTLWTLTASLEVVSQDVFIKVFLSKLTYIHIVTVPVLWYFFSYEYTSKLIVFKQKWIIYFWIIPAITIIIVMTNDYHGLMWSSIYPIRHQQGVLILKYERGIWFTLNAIYCYTLIVIGLVRIIITLMKNGTLKEHFIIIPGVLAPLVGNGLYLMRIVDYDYAPTAFSFMCICIAWVILSGFFQSNIAVAETIFENLEEAIILIDEHENIVGMNPYVQRLLNIKFNGESLMAEKFLPFWDQLKDSIKNESLVNNEVAIKDGKSTRWFSVQINGINKKIPYPGWIISMYDITYKKNYELELEKRKIVAETANEEKSQFLANMSHEFRTPLNGIIGFSDLLSETMLDDLQNNFLYEIKNASVSLLHIVDEILDFSKIEAGKMELEDIPFNLKNLVSEVVSLVSPQAISKGLNISSYVDNDIDNILISDPIRLKQVLNNLTANAVKFTEKGKVEVSVLKLEDFNNSIMLKFIVSDTGIGISQESQKKLFQMFTQADSSTTRKYGGTGLGLSIAKRIIDLLGGEIWIESKEGIGSDFIFTINIRRLAYNNDDINKFQDNQIVQEIALAKGINVLLVEDMEPNRKLACLLLNKLGCNCFMAVDGEEAVKACNDTKFDIIFMDCQMPVMDGYTATENIKLTQNEKTPIIAMTANSSQEDKEKCISAGMNDYLVKPIRQKKLENIITKWG